MRSVTIDPPKPILEGSDWQEDSTLAALTVWRHGEQRTWRNRRVTHDPLVDAWEVTALDGGRRYRRLTMADLDAMRNA